ncbi:MAG: RNA polymerase sigma factor [Planctomycetia bacterium]
MAEPTIDWTDAAAVAACVQQNRPRLIAFVEQRMSAALKQRLDADDILQEVCLAAVRPAGGAADDRPGREPFGWLCHIAEQRIIDAHRRWFRTAKRNVAREVSIDGPLAGGGSGWDAGADAARGLASMLAVSMTTPSQALSRDAKEHRLRILIDGLPADQRQAVHLRYIDGLPTREIAARLGKSDVAVRVMLSRTMQKLQAAFPDASG